MAATVHLIRVLRDMSDRHPFSPTSLRGAVLHRVPLEAHVYAQHVYELMGFKAPFGGSV